jgi:hypothetical protein
MTRVVLDSETRHRLQHQWRRLQLALHGDDKNIPDRKEADLIYRRISDILDNRLRPVEVQADGTVVWPAEVDSWVADQINANFAVNNTGEAEVVMTDRNIRDAILEAKAKMDAMGRHAAPEEPS